MYFRVFKNDGHPHRFIDAKVMIGEKLVFSKQACRAKVYGKLEHNSYKLTYLLLPISKFVCSDILLRAYLAWYHTGMTPESVSFWVTSQAQGYKSKWILCLIIFGFTTV